MKSEEKRFMTLDTFEKEGPGNMCVCMSLGCQYGDPCESTTFDHSTHFSRTENLLSMTITLKVSGDADQVSAVSDQYPDFRCPGLSPSPHASEMDPMFLPYERQARISMFPPDRQ